MTTPYTPSHEKMEKELTALTGQTITIPRETFDQMKRALEAVEVLFGHLAKDSTQKTWLDNARQALSAAKAVQPQAQEQWEQKLYLWKNFVDGRPEYWAFDNAYPINMDNGDPQTLGEPCGYALLKPSRNGSAGRTCKVGGVCVPGKATACACQELGASVSPQASEPQGWKLVPVEPTPEMCDAGADYMNSPTGLIAKNAHYFYKAMLAAAPEATK